MLKDNWNEVKGWGAVAIGFITCPCHLPITLPLAISLTAGTATGAWLTNNTVLIWGLFTVLFLVGLAVGYQLLTKEEKAPQVEKGSKSVLVLTSSTCAPCAETISLWRQLKLKHKFKLQVIDIGTRKGRRLAGERNILSTPVTFINDKIKFRGLPNEEHAIAAVKR